MTRTEATLLSYDLQSGFDIEVIDMTPESKTVYFKKMADKVEKYGPFDYTLNVGVGEATILANFVYNLRFHSKKIYCFAVRHLISIFLSKTYFQPLT